MIRVIQTSEPKPGSCHKLPGWRERRRLGIKHGATVSCTVCGRWWKWDYAYDTGHEWVEGLGSKILHP